MDDQQQCRSCERCLGPNAQTCPHCGEPTLNNPQAFQTFGFLFGLVLLACWFGWWLR